MIRRDANGRFVPRGHDPACPWVAFDARTGEPVLRGRTRAEVRALVAGAGARVVHTWRAPRCH